MLSIKFRFTRQIAARILQSPATWQRSCAASAGKCKASLSFYSRAALEAEECSTCAGALRECSSNFSSERSVRPGCCSASQYLGHLFNPVRAVSNPVRAMSSEAPKQLPTPKPQKVSWQFTRCSSGLLMQDMVAFCICEYMRFPGQNCSLPTCGLRRQRHKHS